MPKITPGNHLYFYQLLSTQLGTGKQTTPQRVEEVLAEADVLLEDVECESIDQLLGELSDFVKLTVFKKGRVFVTIMPREDLDDLLAKAAQPTVDKGAAAAGKSWKRARRTKDVRPAKPRHKRQPTAPQPAAQEATAEVTEALSEEAAPQTTAKHFAKPAAVEEPVAAEAVAEHPEAQEVAAQEVPTQAPADTPVEASTKEPVNKDTATQPAAVVDEANAPQAASDIPSVEETTESDAQVEVPETPAAEVLANTADEAQPTSEASDFTEAEAEPEAQAAPQPAADPAPQPTTTPQPKPETRRPKRIRTTPKLRRINTPKRFSDEVLCPDQHMLSLYQMLPQTIGILDALDEGWDYAQQAGTVEGTRSQMTFPLSRTNLPGHPIEVTFARTPRIASGEAWSVIAVTRDESEDEDEDAVEAEA